VASASPRWFAPDAPRMLRSSRPAARTVAFRRALLGWYDATARDLPWRRTKDPYRIWLSEVMLQQTRVETVIPYYQRFTERFPTVEALAAAPLDDVLRLWAGLGYYSRARNLHRAARHVANELGGEFPLSDEALRVLPGVGDYTAAAIASIAFDEPAAVLDGNVKRVLARVCAIEQPIDEARTLRALRAAADELLPRRRAGDFNQALMELGAVVCLPRAPRCDACPVRRACDGATAGIAADLPVRSRAKNVTSVSAVAGVVVDRGKWLMVRRPERGLLGGLWELPGEEFTRGRASSGRLERCLLRDFGVRVSVGPRYGIVEHVFTHRVLRVHIYVSAYQSGRVVPARHTAWRWVDAEALEELALSALARKTLAVAGISGAVAGGPA